MMPRKQIAIAIVEHREHFLVGVRPDDVPLAGLWEFPGGKVQPLETPAEGAVRECQEETGLAVRIVRLLLRQSHQYAHGSVDLHFFTCQLTGDHREPTAPFRWIARSQLASLEFPSGNRTVLNLLLSKGTD